MKTIKLANGVLDVKAPGYIVHGCNAQGAMGSGVAKAIREKWPQVFRDYSRLFRGMIDNNSLMGVTVFTEVEPSLFVVSGITQLNYGNDGKRYVSYDAVERVFANVYTWAQKTKAPIYFPSIGAGLGGGNWNVIQAIIESVIPEDYPSYHVLLND